MRLTSLSVLFTLVLSACSCGATDTPAEDGQTVAVSPEELSCSAAGGELTLNVTASAGFQVYVADGIDWVRVDPSYSAEPSAAVSVKVGENVSYKDRTADLTVKCGSTRKKVTLTQKAMEKGEIDIEVPEGYHLVWQDEFEDGDQLDRKNWTHEVQKDHWVNNELQNYVNHVSPDGRIVTELVDGALQIHCFKENGKIYSGRVYAHVGEGWLYGWVEARIKLPKGKGTWPAFWMMPVGNDWSTNPWPMCGEIDIMEEVGYDPDVVSSSIHTQDYNHTKNTQKTHSMKVAGAEGDFHVYALEWTADAITTYVDGKVQLSVTKQALGSGHNQWPFHYSFYPILNLAWGGDWGGAKGVDESALPVTMEVDYIRVFQKD